MAICTVEIVVRRFRSSFRGPVNIERAESRDGCLAHCPLNWQSSLQATLLLDKATYKNSVHPINIFPVALLYRHPAERNTYYPFTDLSPSMQNSRFRQSKHAAWMLSIAVMTTQSISSSLSLIKKISNLRNYYVSLDSSRLCRFDTLYHGFSKEIDLMIVHQFCLHAASFTC